MCSLLNIYKIFEFYNSNSDFAGDHASEMKTAFWDLHEQYSGKITQTKINEIISSYADMENDYLNHTFEYEYDKEKFLTGYFSTDYVLYKRDFYNEMKRMAEYTYYCEDLIFSAKENVKFYEKCDNDFEMKKNQIIINTFENRGVTTFYRTEGWECYFKYDFSSLMIVCLLIMCVPTVFTYENEIKMTPLLETFAYGRSNNYISKLISVFVETFLTLLIFTVIDLISFNACFILTNPCVPVYSIESFANTPFDISILTSVVIDFIFKLIGFYNIALLMIFISLLSSNSIISYVIGLISVMVQVFLYVYTNFSPLQLVLGRGILKQFDVINVCSLAVPFHLLLPLIYLTINILFDFSIYFLARIRGRSCEI